MKKTSGSLHEHLFKKKNVRKNQKEKVYEFWKEGVQELFTHKEGASVPRARHEERHPLIKCGIKITWLQN